MSDKTTGNGRGGDKMKALVGFLKRRINCLRGKHEWVPAKGKTVNFTTTVSSAWLECSVCGKTRIDFEQE